MRRFRIAECGLRNGPTLTLIIALASNVLGAPLAAEAQQAARLWRIGLFHVGVDHIPPSLVGLREGLRALGYQEGKNISQKALGLKIPQSVLIRADEVIQ